MRRGVLVVMFTTACGGKMLGDVDAGDASKPDAAIIDSGGGDDSGLFSCGETGHFVYCSSGTMFCKLVRTSSLHAYSCEVEDANPCAGQPAASAPYDCGCYTAPNGDSYLTLCQ
jgi:hypothetical protein